MSDPKEIKFNPELKNQPVEGLEGVAARESEGVVVETIEQAEPVLETPQESVTVEQQDSESEEGNKEIGNSKSFDPELAYTTAIGEDRQQSVENYVVGNGDLTKPGAADQLWKTLESYINGETK